jgi:hypothetical protein
MRDKRPMSRPPFESKVIHPSSLLSKRAFENAVSLADGWPPPRTGSGERLPGTATPKPYCPGVADNTEGVRSTKDVEIKWGTHHAGEKRTEWTRDDQRATLVLLVDGNFLINLTEGSAQLTRQGDYAVWGSGIDHFRKAKENSVVITVRWPSPPPRTVDCRMFAAHSIEGWSTT